MNKSLALAVVLCAASVTLSTSSRAPESEPAPAAQPTVAANAEANRMWQRQPNCFVPNLGQWQHGARYVARFGAMTVFLQEQGWTFTLVERTREKAKPTVDQQSAPPFGPRETDPVPTRGVAVRMTFEDAGAAQLAPGQRLPGVHHYFLGNDEEKWRSDVPLYGAVRYREMWPGVDVLAREQGGHFEYDLVLQPDAELECVEIAVEGIERMHIGDGGALVLETALGPVRMPAPPSWEEGPSGERNPIACRYVMLGDDRFGFEAPARRPGWAMVVDPGLVWSTFLGGTSTDQVSALAVDAQGAVTVAGSTLSATFPTTAGAFDTTFDGWAACWPWLCAGDAFVTRLSPSGSSLVYSTFLGGADLDTASALAVDPQGAATVAGPTKSTNFPTTAGAFDTTYNGGSTVSIDSFVTRLSPDGSSLVYSTFLGGMSHDLVRALALDAQGAATVAGSTNSTNFPTTPSAFDTTYHGSSDVFVTRLSPSGSSLLYSTLLGGPSPDEVHALAVNVQGTATIAGWTRSGPAFPTTPGAFATNPQGYDDAFVTRLSPSGSSLVYSTFLGGTSTDQVSALAVDAQGAATVAGYTFSSNFPTTSGAFDTTYNGGAICAPYFCVGDAFITRLSPSGSSVVYSTFLGGSGGDAAYALALDTQGAATVAGSSSSTDFPATTGAYDTTYNGGGMVVGDAFVTRLSPSGSSVVYSTFLGGTNDDQANTLALDAQGAAIVAGWTDSSNFPTTTGAFDTTFDSGDAFITRLDMLPTGVSAYGISSPGCTGPLAISVTSMPQVGNTAFSLTCGNAPPNAMGCLLVGDARFASPPTVLGVDVLVDPGSGAFFAIGSLTSDQVGAAEFVMPIQQNTPLGIRVFAQFVWCGPTAPAPCPPFGLSASHALDITVQ